MTHWIAYGHVLVKILLVTLVLSLVWTLWPIIMALLGLVGAYYLLALLLKALGFTKDQREAKEEQK